MADVNGKQSLQNWLVTTLLALFVAVLDISFFLSSYLKDLSEKITVIGIVTFFGMMIVSAYHEHTKGKNKVDTEDKEDKEIMRTSIAGTLVIIYIIVLASTLFSDKANGTDSIFQTTFNNFGNVIVVVVGFYFGSKGAIQIYRIHRKHTENNSSKGSGKSSPHGTSPKGP